MSPMGWRAGEWLPPPSPPLMLLLQYRVAFSMPIDSILFSMPVRREQGPPRVILCISSPTPLPFGKATVKRAAPNFIYHPEVSGFGSRHTPAVRDILHRPEKADRCVCRRNSCKWTNDPGRIRDGDASLARKFSCKSLISFSISSGLLAIRFSGLNWIMQTRSITI